MLVYGRWDDEAVPASKSTITDMNDSPVTIQAYQEPEEVVIAMDEYHYISLDRMQATKFITMIIAALASIPSPTEHHTGTLGLTGAGNE